MQFTGRKSLPYEPKAKFTDRYSAGILDNPRNLTLVFFLQVVAIKTGESVTLVHTIRITKLEANLAARPENVWTYLF